MSTSHESTRSARCPGRLIAIAPPETRPKSGKGAVSGEVARERAAGVRAEEAVLEGAIEGAIEGGMLLPNDSAI